MASKGGEQYETRYRAAAVLHKERRVAYARLVELFAGLFGLRVSEGTLVAAVGRLAPAPAPHAAAVAEEVWQSPVISSDQTSARCWTSDLWKPRRATPSDCCEVAAPTYALLVQRC